MGCDGNAPIKKQKRHLVMFAASGTSDEANCSDGDLINDGNYGQLGGEL